MCRHLAWLGAPRSLSELLLEPDHGLLVQSYAPRRQRHGLMNADGWGVGLLRARAVRSQLAGARTGRLWSDASFASVAPVISSACVLAAVRSATRRDARSTRPPSRRSSLGAGCSRTTASSIGRCSGPHPAAESVCDSAQLAAHLFEFGPDRVGEFVTAARQARSWRPAEPAARPTASGSSPPGGSDTLSVLQAGDGVVVASEPYDDDPRWTMCPIITSSRSRPTR